MRDTTKKKQAAILCAVIVIGVLAAYLALILYPLFQLCFGETVAMVFLFSYALAILAIIIGILAALWQRLKELEGGEEENAKMY